MDDWEGMAGPEQQLDNESRRFEEEQLRKDSEAFDRMMQCLWDVLRNQWRQK